MGNVKEMPESMPRQVGKWPSKLLETIKADLKGIRDSFGNARRGAETLSAILTPYETKIIVQSIGEPYGKCPNKTGDPMAAFPSGFFSSVVFLFFALSNYTTFQSNSELVRQSP